MTMRILQRGVIYATLLLGSVLFLMPLLLMISTGLKPIEQTMSVPPTWIPYRLYVQKDHVLTEIKQAEVGKYAADSIIRKPAPRWGNYVEAIRAMKMFPRYLRNTLVLCVLTVVGTVVSSSLAAYGFSRIEWRGRNSLFVLALATMMVPFPVTMVPLYCLFRSLGWIGTLKPLWVGSFFAGAFNVFLLRQFFMTLPKDLSEAARIDGCGEFRIF